MAFALNAANDAGVMAAMSAMAILGVCAEVNAATCAGVKAAALSTPIAATWVTDNEPT